MVRNAVREQTKRAVAKEADLYSWARRQAELLRAGRLSEIDAAANETGLSLSVFPVRRPFEYTEIMERSVVWPGDEE